MLEKCLFDIHVYLKSDGIMNWRTSMILNHVHMPDGISVLDERMRESTGGFQQA